MPQIVEHAAPWVHALANLGQAAGGLGDAINDQRKTDMSLQEAQARLALERSGEARDQKMFDYRMKRAEVEDAQRDEYSKLRNEGMGYQNDYARMRLDGIRGSAVGPDGPQPVGEQDASIDADLFRSEAGGLLDELRDVQPLEHEALRRKIDDLAGTIRNYGAEDPDPDSRRERRRQLSSFYMDKLRRETVPLRRGLAQQILGNMKMRGSLSSNPAAQEGLDVLLQKLNDPNGDPDAVMQSARSLQMGVAGDAKHNKRRELAISDIDQLMGMTMGDSQRMLMLSDIQQDVLHDLVSPEEGMKQARRLMWSDEDKTSDEEWAAERAMRSSRADDGPEMLDQRYEFLLRARRQGRRRGRGLYSGGGYSSDTPFSMQGVGVPDITSSRFGNRGSSVATSGETAPSPDDAATGSEGGSAATSGPQSPEVKSSAGPVAAPKTDAEKQQFVAQGRALYASLRNRGMTHEQASAKVAAWSLEQGVDPRQDPSSWMKSEAPPEIHRPKRKLDDL